MPTRSKNPSSDHNNTTFTNPESILLSDLWEGRGWPRLSKQSAIIKRCRPAIKIPSLIPHIQQYQQHAGFLGVHMPLPQPQSKNKQTISKTKNITKTTTNEKEECNIHRSGSCVSPGGSNLGRQFSCYPLVTWRRRYRPNRRCDRNAGHSESMDGAPRRPGRFASWVTLRVTLGLLDLLPALRAVKCQYLFCVSILRTSNLIDLKISVLLLLLLG